MRQNIHAFAQSRHWQQLRRVAPALLTTLFLVGAAWHAAALTWSAIEFATTEPTLPPPASLALEGESADGERPSMQAVANAHLFGHAEAPRDDLAAAAADAPETRLNLKLRGILAADDPEYSRAIITSGNQDKVYSVGDAVAGGASVEAVLADRVLLRRGGQLETLRLPRESMDSGVTMTEAAPEPPPTQAPDMADLRAEIAADPTKLSELIRYSPVLEDGAVRGYRIYPGRDRARFSQLGLQPGDIVTAINGVDLSDPRQAAEMMNSLTDASDVTLTVERNGVPQQVSLSASH